MPLVTAGPVKLLVLWKKSPLLYERCWILYMFKMTVLATLIMLNNKKKRKWVKVFFKAMPNLEITLGGMFMRMVFPLNSEVFPAVFIRITNVQSSILLTSMAPLTSIARSSSLIPNNAGMYNFSELCINTRIFWFLLYVEEAMNDAHRKKFPCVCFGDCLYSVCFVMTPVTTHLPLYGVLANAILWSSYCRLSLF